MDILVKWVLNILTLRPRACNHVNASFWFVNRFTCYSASSDIFTSPSLQGKGAKFSSFHTLVWNEGDLAPLACKYTLYYMTFWLPHECVIRTGQSQTKLKAENEAWFYAILRHYLSRLKTHF